MKKVIVCLVSLAASMVLFGADINPVVEIQTSMGNIEVELYQDKAPVTVKNFLAYINEGYYNGTIFHRVIKNFMIQGGGFTESYKQKKTNPPIKNEADNKLKNLTGTIAMARTSNPNSATAQFFINTANNTFLDYTSPTRRGWGYTVFGKVIRGMDVVEKIDKLKTGSGGPFAKDVPKIPVIIEKLFIIKNKN